MKIKFIPFSKFIKNLNLYKNEERVYILSSELFNKITKTKHKIKIKYAVKVPCVIYNGKIYYHAGLVISFKKKLEGDICFIDLKYKHEKLYENIESLLSFPTWIIFIDAFSKYMYDFIDYLNNLIETKKINIVGAAIGDIDFKQAPCFIYKGKTYKDAALILGIKQNIDIEIAKGWEPLYGPLVVTQSKNNIILEINGEPAFNVYKYILKTKLNLDINKKNLKNFILKYPFGVISLSEDSYSIIYPIHTNGKKITTLSKIPIYTNLFIMKPNESAFLKSISEASFKLYEKNKKNNIFVFSALSRGKVLKNKELERIKKINKDFPKKIFGFCTIGEITNIGFNNIKLIFGSNLVGALKYE